MKKSTLYIDMNKDLIDYIKNFATNNSVSISEVLSQLVLTLKKATKRDMVKREATYEESKKKALELLNKGFHMGGKITCSREELYEL
jgi:hypothetical protein